MKVIKLPEGSVQWPIGTEGQWIGRNGYFASIGLMVTKRERADQSRDSVVLHPVGTRGKLGNCMIEIPNAAIPDVICALAKALTLSPEKGIASPLRADSDRSSPAPVAMGQGERSNGILRMDADFMADVERR
jgi:hypothetical protein